MNTFESGQGHHRSTSSNDDVRSEPHDKDVTKRVRAWRVALIASITVFLLSLAMSGHEGVATATLAYMGVGGIIVSILGIVRVGTTGEARGSRGP